MPEKEAIAMQRISLNVDDFTQIRNSLDELVFQPRNDHTPAHPLLLRHLHDYRFPARQSPHVEFRVGQIPAQGFKVCCYYWLPASPRGTTFLVHGYFDHVGLYGHLIEHLIQQGQAVVAFDLPGHGLSGGERLAIDSFARYESVFSDLLARLNHFPRPFSVIGQSTGAAIVLRFLQSRNARHEPCPFRNIWLLAPLIKPWHWRFSIWLYRLLNGRVRTTKRKFRRNSHDMVFAEFLEHHEPLQANRIPLIWVGAMKQWIADFNEAPTCTWPITVIQGQQDTTVDWRYNISAIERQFPNAQLVWLPQAMHHLVNEREDIRSQVFGHVLPD